ncbi:hypothetical protein [Streptomyces sp. NPDC096153]
MTRRDGAVEHLDAIVPAVGHKPDLGYRATLGARDRERPRPPP